MDGATDLHNEGEYEVQEVVESGKFRNSVQYRLRWKGYEAPDYRWYNWNQLDNCLDLVREFHLRHPDAVKHKNA